MFQFTTTRRAVIESLIKSDIEGLPQEKVVAARFKAKSEYQGKTNQELERLFYNCTSDIVTISSVVNTCDLEGEELEWVVAHCEHAPVNEYGYLEEDDNSFFYSPSTDWSQGGPIIERERIQVTPGYPHDEYKWAAIKYDHIFVKEKDAFQGGDTYLIAAMRCYVTSKLGDTVDLKEIYMGEDSLEPDDE